MEPNQANVDTVQSLDCAETISTNNLKLFNKQVPREYTPIREDLHVNPEKRTKPKRRKT